MKTKSGLIFASFVLTFCFSALTIAQPKEQSKMPGREGMRHFEKMLTVTLTTEPGNEAQGITITTADGNFVFNSTRENAEGRTEISFQGKIEPEESDSALVTYHLGLGTTTKSGQNSDRIDLQGSVLVRINNVVSIAKTKDRTFKLKLAAAE